MTEAVSQTMTHKAPGREPLTPDRPRIAAASLVGWLVGLLPYALFGYRRGWFGVALVVAYLAVALVVAFKSAKTDTSHATEEPSRGEWFLAACSATGEGATTTLLGLLLYGLGFWGAQLVNVVAVRVLGLSAALTAETSGFWLSVLPAAGMGLALVGVATAKLTRALYPEYAGARSAYFPLLDQSVKFTAFASGVAASVITALTLSMLFPGAWWAAVIAAAVLVYVSIPLDRLGRDAQPRQIDVTDGAAEVLQNAGYTVTRSPRTGNPEVDPLIRNVTLLASSGAEGFAIEITDRDPDVPLEWRAASGVLTASAILQQRMTVDGRPLSSVRPILVMVGGSSAPSLTRFAEKEGVSVVQLALTSASDRRNDGERLIDSLRTAGIPFPAHAPAAGGQVRS